MYNYQVRYHVNGRVVVTNITSELDAIHDLVINIHKDMKNKEFLIVYESFFDKDSDIMACLPCSNIDYFSVKKAS